MALVEAYEGELDLRLGECAAVHYDDTEEVSKIVMFYLDHDRQLLVLGVTSNNTAFTIVMMVVVFR